MEFPAGEEMDSIAINEESASKLLSPIKVKDGWLNLSGIDTQFKRILEDEKAIYTNSLIKELFEKTSDAMFKMIVQGSEKTGLNKLIMAGGVSSSKFIRNKIFDKLSKEGIHIIFSDNDLSQDNAVGTALLGGKAIWR